MERHHHVNILIVDDKEENIYSLERIIENENRTVFKAMSGNEGLKHCLSVDFDLILCDVQMPGMDGFEMLELLRLDPKKRNIPFIFITAINKEEKYVNRGYNEGAVDYLFKPLDVHITRSKVDVFVEMARQKKELISKNIQLKSLHEQKNQFLGMLAHDLRNPIGALQHYCSYFIENSQLNTEQVQMLKSMHDSSSYMLNLVNDLLDISHLESGKMNLNPEPVNLSNFISDIININRLFAKQKNITIEGISIPVSQVCEFDAPKIRQVLNNLIGNAIKFSHPDSTIRILVNEKNNNLSFEVKDEGQGIPSHELNKLFKPFESTSVKSTSGEKSTGLGLSICSSIVECHGGKISVTSEVGKGSTFLFHIPYKSIQIQETLSPFEFPQTHFEPKQIIVADDNDINQLVLKKLLEKLGHTVHFAGNGVEVLTKMDNTNIDIIFMDVEMPEMNGLEATKEIKFKNQNKVKIIGCSGHRGEKDYLRCIEAGMDTCISKPINRESVLQALDLVINNN